MCAILHFCIIQNPTAPLAFEFYWKNEHAPVTSSNIRSNKYLCIQNHHRKSTLEKPHVRQNKHA